MAASLCRQLALTLGGTATENQAASTVMGSSLP
jgi:hypothetical protein